MHDVVLYITTVLVERKKVVIIMFCADDVLIYHVFLVVLLCMSCRIIEDDAEKITFLEKRQVHLMTENDTMRVLIEETVRENNHMMSTMDLILNSAMFNNSSHELTQNGLPVDVAPDPTVSVI